MVVKSRTSLTERAGIIFPVSRCRNKLRKGRYAKHIGLGAAVYMAAVLEYLVAEMVELSGNAARDNKRKRLTPRHLLLAIRNDEELNALLSHVTIGGGGVIPNIQPEMLPKKTAKKNQTDPSASTSEY